MRGAPTVVGLASPGARWPAEVARWCTGGTVAADFSTCLTIDELRASLVLRRVDVVILDTPVVFEDRGILLEVRARGAAAIGIDPAMGSPVGVAEHFDAMLADGFTPRSLTELLLKLDPPGETSARTGVEAADAGTVHRSLGESRRLHGRMIGVTSNAGAGASVVAMALAQGLSRREETVALVDGARRGQLCMYHDVGDVVPGLTDLVESQRSGILDPAEVRELLFEQPERGYRLLLGHRHPRDSIDQGARALGSALDAVARSYDMVVVDHDPDVEVGISAGHGDLGDRHAIARHLLTTAEVEVVVSRPGTKGVHDAARRIDELVDAGRPAERLVVCCNRAGRSPAARASFERSVRALTRAHFHDVGTLEVVHLGTSRRIETALRDALPLPRSQAAALAKAVRDVLGSLPRRPLDAAPDLERLA
jgi:Mrp family chromosome partitioning ATPase